MDLLYCCKTDHVMSDTDTSLDDLELPREALPYTRDVDI